VTLSWSTQAGTFLGAFIDHGVGRRAPSGHAGVPDRDHDIPIARATAEGGATSEVTVWVDEFLRIFADGFESGDASAWSSSVGD
jgi:hypothetical protein